MTLWSLINPYKKLIWLTLLFGWATLGMNIGLQSTSSYLIAKAATRPSTILLLWVPIVAVRLFGTGRGVVRYADRLTAHNLTLTWLRDLRVQVYEWVEPWTTQEWEAVHTGDLVMRASADVDTLQNLFIAVWEPVAVGVLALGIVVLVGQFLNWQLAWSLVLMLIVMGVVLSWSSHWLSRHLSASLVHRRARLSAAIVEAWHGAIDTISFNQAGRVLHDMHRMDSLWIRTKVALHRLSGLFQGLITFVTWAGLWVIVVFAIRLVDRHQLPAILLPVAALLTLASFELINGLPAAFQEWGEMTAARQRLGALHRHSPASFPSEAQELGRFPTIELHDVSVRYPPQETSALAHIHLRLDPGVHMALVGPNGSGKSTLIAVIAGLTDITGGQVTVDGREYNRPSSELIRRRLGVVNQTPHIFETTLEENLRLGRVDAPEDDLHQAITIAGLEPLIDTLPDGLATPLGSRGITLSGGEIKRIAVARMILKDAPILLLDEPAEGLDPDSARDVLSRLFTWAQGRTILWVTHHLSNLDLIDHVVIMDGGQIREQGPFSALRKHNPWVQSMIRHQRLVIPPMATGGSV